MLVLSDLADSPWYKLELKCGDIVYTVVKLRQQYENDKHYVLCPSCRFRKNRDVYHRPPTAWSEVINVTGVTDATVSNVLSGSAFILHRDIMRLQPSVGPSRVRPFPYANGSAK